MTRRKYRGIRWAIDLTALSILSITAGLLTAL
ncbi:Hypothetical protein SCLAV_p0257 (plasmid) [Streptomyces clavuligerus]|uniref:Uncharacterized protein n=1 Tax=Streptomyces clavuligerus TaxID=1901 RepID=B5GRV2_STRCL|nr:hypothetical protein SSCG_02076 [Streptomyces clavuligerus]EFG03748.1 Hypothetical protein SCLAV_p0257 [Streptomyces clavuligerus]